MKYEDVAKRLSKEWGLVVNHALYSSGGVFYNRIRRFPGALLDDMGFILFRSEKDFYNCKHLRIGERVHVTNLGISTIPGYVQVVWSNR